MGKTLDKSAYQELAVPSENNKIEFFSSTKEGLYNDIIMKFMMHENGASPHH
jgi:cytochrome o ubiquinol oxidase subunit 2